MRCLYGLVSTWGGAAKERRERRKKEGGCALGPKRWFMRPDNEVAVSNCLCSLGYLQADQSARMWSGSRTVLEEPLMWPLKTTVTVTSMKKEVIHETHLCLH